MSLATVLDRSRVVVCVGSGGVGKTTCAAALGLEAARRGRRAMVLTIDPAHRLAQALGLDRLAAGGQRIDQADGQLSAGVLDVKSAWDEFIARHAPNPEVCRRILANRFYRQLSSSFAGSTEYMALEELCRITESGDYDLIVLDTPPSRHALDFLDAPRRIEAFFDRRIVGWFVGPWRLASRSARFILSRIEDATGLASFGEISDFFMSMDTLFEGIAGRSAQVRGLLGAADTSFVLVAGPDEEVLGESEYLSARMGEFGIDLAAVVMNRVHLAPAGANAGAGGVDDITLEVRERLGRGGVDGQACRWITDTYQAALTTSRAEEVRRKAFESGLAEGVTVTTVPEMDGDVHDLEGLARVADFLVPA